MLTVFGDSDRGTLMAVASWAALASVTTSSAHWLGARLLQRTFSSFHSNANFANQAFGFTDRTGLGSRRSHSPTAIARSSPLRLRCSSGLLGKGHAHDTLPLPSLPSRPFSLPLSALTLPTPLPRHSRPLALPSRIVSDFFLWPGSTAPAPPRVARFCAGFTFIVLLRTALTNLNRVALLRWHAGTLARWHNS